MSITLPNLKHSFNCSGSGSGSGSGFRIPGSGFPCFPYARIKLKRAKTKFIITKQESVSMVL